jgi:hypothetical protein
VSLSKATALIGLLALALTASAQAAPPKLIYGVNDHRFLVEWPQTSKLAAPLGLSRIAVEIRWWNGKIPGGDLDAIPRSQPITLILAGRRYDSTFHAYEQAAFCDYAAKLVALYPNVRELQIWNEPAPAPSFSWGLSMRDYLDLLAVCYDRLRGKVTVLAPGSHPARNVQLDFVQAVRDYYRATKRTRPLFDGYSVHPYWNWQTKPVAGAMNWAWRNLPQRSPQRGLRFWWTETGFESTVPEPYSDPYIGTSLAWALLGSPEQQAARVAEITLRAYCNPLVAAVFNFLLVDEPQLNGWQSGFYYVGGTPKPAFYSYQTAIRRTRSPKFRCGRLR